MKNELTQQGLLKLDWSVECSRMTSPTEGDLAEKGKVHMKIVVSDSLRMRYPLR